MTGQAIFTYQTKLKIPKEINNCLEKMAAHLSRVERSLFADYAKGKNIQDLKSDYLQEHQITARHFNGIRCQLEGKIAAVNVQQERQLKQLEPLIQKVKARLQKLQGSYVRKKQEQLARLEKRQKQLLEDKKQRKVRLCFGSKRLFSAQFNLEKNGYKSHEEWKEAWTRSRNSSFFILGSKDESAGNQTCQAIVKEDGTLSLQLRLPDALITGGDKYLILEKLSFAYGQEELLAALKNCQKREELKGKNNPSYKHFGQAVSYRFKTDGEDWTVYVSVAVSAAPICTHLETGTIGIDINADHIAAVEIDPQGNPIHIQSFPLVTYGKSSHQTEALIGDVSAELVSWAQKAGRPLVLEELDFEQKKQELKKDPAKNRRLSSFVYGKTITAIQSKGYRTGVEVIFVDPAYTSTMGKVKYAVRYGLTIHESAALCIARRGHGVFEKVPCHWNKIPDGKGGYVALQLPARKHCKHEEPTWRYLHKKLQAELVAHFRAMKSSIFTRRMKTITRLKGRQDILEICRGGSGMRIVGNTA